PCIWCSSPLRHFSTSYSPLSKQSICLCTICPFLEVLNIAFSPPFNSISLLHPLILADNSSQAFAFSYFFFNSATISTTSPLPFVIEYSLYKSDSIWFRSLDIQFHSLFISSRFFHSF